jgi:hypothetical protein
MEPISTALAGIALVKGATDAIKSCINTCNDISEIAGYIDNLFEGQAQVNKERNKKSGVGAMDGIGGVASEMIDAKLASEKLYEVSMLVDLRFGSGTWRSIVEERARRIQAQKERAKQQALEQAAQRKEIFDGLSMLFYLVMGVLVVGLIALVAFKASASIPKMTTCRLAHTEVISKKEILCFYQGANNTQESHTTELHVGCARSYQCEYNPRPSGYSLKGTLDSIKDALK